MPGEGEIFECRRCGQCCEGRGGIVLSPKDLSRLALFLGDDESTVAASYGEISNGKLKIRCGPDARCLFYKSGHGCLIHPARPDICRAWPFFRGNLVDPVSFELAREYCPGMGREMDFETFVSAGKEYLTRHGLFATNGACEARALLPVEEERS